MDDSFLAHAMRVCYNIILMVKLASIGQPSMNRSEVTGMNAVPAAAPEEGSDPDSPDIHSGLFKLNMVIDLEA